MPESLDALEKYLANGLIKGVGPATAKNKPEWCFFNWSCARRQSCRIIHPSK